MRCQEYVFPDRQFIQERGPLENDTDSFRCPGIIDGPAVYGNRAPVRPEKTQEMIEQHAFAASAESYYDNDLASAHL